ncbi:hypothetical protein A3H85_01550 [Candidatus Daviesbacteria bacterium RIFCSPLOWO2_02_FULL_40_8]|uniref:PD-(D/E)XK endonuclease-like domain-containing protein n=1 Tax=Candidatus Daviesbacteria bacterium RIFCSPLOWO2_01_FULL_40_24 TaxID=1797787 RepID=A0A1F5MKK9_9BACT|nr:MAG: hypothetical protein A2780_00485 [Candidatus Daviesbacteria bacterium RIFCSPHIGHO2_01_FULL_41_45]OGE34026.1 MAG: hypothetical protein A3C32_00615 [Candidatus Daviesbacteria bacterium RIFCSPHIGHO2_02_FULL_41_14]OGE65830.1 MAG: hypothetical protein A3B49_03460 [Candidatus Daviesbacteria bacterium RIFCSPLOWO2_01_FULL_40_24]OGE66912.1 MAG: hypothetical protein A3H85_01550 [Candidatus Daviesbacteria bacterium RIFCSPLOWO2_02_FULL_40_8]
MSQMVPRYRCFSLGDFKEFEKCVFSFLVKHHLEKKYQLAEGSENQALGSLLDLSIKKIHGNQLYNQPIEVLLGVVKASEMEMRQKSKNGKDSYYGSQIPFLNEELVDKAKKILRDYYQAIDGKFQKSLSRDRFWDREIAATDGNLLKLWGGPDTIEEGKDTTPEVIDYKYFEDNEKGKDYLDWDLMPKLYVLLTAVELQNQGYQKVRFKIRCWQDPTDDSLFEEFDLSTVANFEEFFREKMERILRTEDITFCEKAYCRVCQSDLRKQWEVLCRSKSWLSSL